MFTREPARTALDPARRRIDAIVDWWFRDRRTGRITVAQFPNIPLWLFLASVALRWVVPIGAVAHSFIDWIGVVALVWWALDELFRGVNPWRQLLGLGGCAFAAARLASLLG